MVGVVGVWRGCGGGVWRGVWWGGVVGGVGGVGGVAGVWWGCGGGGGGCGGGCGGGSGAGVVVLLLTMVCVSFLDTSCAQVPSPPEWEHGNLGELTSFLRERVADGSFVPLLEEGL